MKDFANCVGMVLNLQNLTEKERSKLALGARAILAYVKVESTTVVEQDSCLEEIQEMRKIYSGVPK